MKEVFVILQSVSTLDQAYAKRGQNIGMQIVYAPNYLNCNFGCLTICATRPLKGTPGPVEQSTVAASDGRQMNPFQDPAPKLLRTLSQTFISDNPYIVKFLKLLDKPLLVACEKEEASRQ